jgi:hypothetical protein
MGKPYCDCEWTVSGIDEIRAGVVLRVYALGHWSVGCFSMPYG